MRILFAGSPAIAIPSLKAIFDLEEEGRGFTLAGLLTNGDSRRGRGSSLEPTEVSAAASELSQQRQEAGRPPLVQLKPTALDASFRKEAAALKADLLVSFAYGRIFGPKFLSLFSRGGINLHPSLLPLYRGASPIQAAILNQDTETGVCIQKLAEKMDRGDILSKEVIKLQGDETALSLSQKVAEISARLLRETLLGFDRLQKEARPQEGPASYCSQIKKEEGLINWNKSAADICAQVRAFLPWPLAYTRRGTETLYLLEAGASDAEAEAATMPGTVMGLDPDRGILIQTGKGLLEVRRLQWGGKKALPWKDFCNGTRNFTGSTLG